jgi:hypothetical protein
MHQIIDHEIIMKMIHLLYGMIGIQAIIIIFGDEEMIMQIIDDDWI